MRGLRALGVLGLLLALSCGRPTRSRPVEVTFWQTWPVEALAPLVHRYEAENPSIHVAVSRLPAEGAADTLALAVQQGRPPDLVELSPEQTASFIGEGLLSDWSAGVADLKPTVRGWELCSLGDAIYGLPWLLRTRVLVYNRALFARAGIDTARAPDTWEEMKSAAARVEALGAGVHGLGLPAGRHECLDTFLPFAWGNGGDVFSARLDSCVLDSPENLQALKFLVSLGPMSLVADGDSVLREFGRGRLGMLIADARLSAAARDRAARFSQGVALVPRPTPDRGTHATLGAGAVLASFTRSRRKEDALKFARFLAEQQNTVALASALESVFPPHLGVADAAEYRDRPDQRLFLQQLETAHFEPLLRDGDLMLGVVDSLVGEALAHRLSPRAAVELGDSLIRKLGVTR